MIEQIDFSGGRSLVYQITNLVNQKRYIGITKRSLDTRWLRHIRTAKSGGGAVFGAAIRKYGHKSFDFKTLVVCPNFGYAKDLEVAAIKMFKPEYNVTAGGDGVVGFRHSEEHKARVGQLQRGNTYWLGKKHSPETKEKMRLARLKIWSEREHSRKHRSFYRKPYVKKQVKENASPVILESTGEVFPSIKAATDWSGYHRCTIRKMCQEDYKSSNRGLRVKGLKFRYLRDIGTPKET